MAAIITTAIAWAAANVTVSALITVASMAYQMVQAKKMRKAAAAAAEARKGFELVAEGIVQPIPIVYGRAIIGGTRVYHNTSSSFNYTPNSANKTFSTGAAATTGGSLTAPLDPITGQPYINVDTGNPYVNESWSGNTEKQLNTNISGAKNEFLFFQQALCLGPINAVYDVVIDDNQFLNDPALGDSYTGYVFKSGYFVNDADNKAALRLDYFYNGGVDTLMAANFVERSTATFTNIAYLSATIRLDRDEPQFSGRVPNIQTFIEGRKVRAIDRTGSPGSYSYTISSIYTYSNNPAYCLLDYLLDSSVGQSLTETDIDLASFYNAAQLCDIVVQSNVNVGGNIWKTTDGTSRNISTRNLPLYECNIIIDVTKPIRENVESILSTMGDARLVWSQGTYKLNLQYPETNANIVLAATFTDDDLVHDKSVEITWPSASERLNQCTVRFNNEANNFKEDSVSWPPKINRTYTRGLGAKKYVAVSGWEGYSDGEKLLNNYAVWDGGTTTTTMTWKIIAPVSGTYTLKFTADDTITITLVTSSSNTNYTSVSTITRTLTANTEYTITINATDNGIGFRGAAAILIAPDGTTVWTTRSEAYTSFVTVTETNTIYNGYLSEDNNVKLETDIFAEGTVDYYHAIAKAEETVRISRSARTIRFQYILKNNFLEPGDIIKLNSATLSLGNTSDLYVRVNEVKLQEGSICEIVGSQFDAAQLVWRTKSAEAIKAMNLYNFFLYAPTNLKFTSNNNIITDSPGTLTWSSSSSPSVSGYILYFHELNNQDANSKPIFVEIGRVTASPFYVPDLGSVVGIFGIRAFTDSVKSDMNTTAEAILVDAAFKPPTPANLVSTLSGDFGQVVKLTWTIPTDRVSTEVPPVTFKYIDHDYTKIYRAKAVTAPALPVYSEIGISKNNEFIDISPEFGDLLYKVVLVSTKGKVSGDSATSSINLYEPNYLGPQVTLTNDTHQVPCEPDGTSPLFTDSGTNIYVYENETALLYSSTGTAAGTWTISSKVDTGVTSGTITAGPANGYAILSNLTAFADDYRGSVRFNISGKTLAGTTFTASNVQHLTKLRNGAAAVKSINTSTPVVYKDAPDNATSGAFSTIIVSGTKSTTAGTVPFGWIGVTPYVNSAAGAESFVFRSFTATPSNSDQTTRWLVKLYDYDSTIYNGSNISQPPAGTAVVDTEEIQVAFKGATGAAGAAGAQGPQGPTGATLYTWIAYANNSTGTSGFTTGSWTNQTYIGISNNQTSSTEGTDPTAYTWSLIKGDQGVPGSPGADGVTTYTWFAYANNASGTSGFTTGAWSNQTYLGIATNKTTETESQNPADYFWSKIEGPQGPTGPQGPQGATGPQGNPGVSGTKSITITAFKWSNSGAGSYSQSFTYTWSNGGVDAYPSGWASSAGAAPSSGYILYQINLIITDSASAATTNANWSSATLNTIGYRQDGSIGSQGDSYRIAYFKSTSATPPGSPGTSTGSTSIPAGWSSSPMALTDGEFMYQSDGVYVVSTNTITWSAGYLSNLKVGNLSAISANLGVVGIATGGSLSSTGKTYGGATAGFFLGWDSSAYKFDIGDSTNYLRWSGTGLNIKGAITATSISFDTGVKVSTNDVSGLAAVATSGNKADVGLGSVSNLDPQNQAQSGIISGVTITGGGITMSSGGSIKAGQTAYDTGTGFFLGFVGANPNFSIGNSAGNKLTWNSGTGTLSVKGAITATSISFEPGVTVGASNVSGLAAVATSGNKTDIGLGSVSNLDPQNQAQSGITTGVTITGGGITMSSGGSVKAGKSDYGSATAGFFLGYSGTTYKFDIGDSTNYLRWSGTGLTIAGSIDTVSTIAGISAGIVVSNASNGQSAYNSLSSKLDKQSTYILGTTAGTNQISLKTANYDAGNGLIITDNGILGKKGSSTTFAVDTNGDATFKGTLDAATISGSGISAGSANAVFKANSDGSIQVGHATFSSAPFRVTNAGALTATSATITGTLAAGSIITDTVTLNTAGGTSLATVASNAVNGNSAFNSLSSKLDKQSTYILGTTAGTNQISLKTTNYDNGNGLIITDNGILGKKAGNTTFAVDTNGDATFKGDITGSSGTFGGNLDVTGTAIIRGINSVAFSLTSNIRTPTTPNADVGVLATGSFYGVYGVGGSKTGVYGTTSGEYGVYGKTTGGTSTVGVFGEGGTGIGVDATSSYIAVRATASGSGTALYVAGPMQITSTTVVTNLNADKVDGKDASAFVEVASGTTNAKYLYFVNNNTAPSDPVNRAAWIKLSTNDGAVVWVPGYI